MPVVRVDGVRWRLPNFLRWIDFLSYGASNWARDQIKYQRKTLKTTWPQWIEKWTRNSIQPNHILVSYDVSALFTNVPLKETIDIIVDKAFEGDLFKKTHSMQLEKHQLTDLLEIATMNQLFQLNGELYEQTEGVTMGSPPLGPLLANVFMCHIENQLE